MRTDEELASAAQRGDRAAAQTLLSRYQDRLLGMALRLLRNRQDAQEAVQQGMFKALANLDKYDASRPFSPWVFRVVRNVCVDVHRRRKPKDEVDDRTMASTTFEDGGARYFRSAESRLQQQQLNDALSEAIDGLGDKYREVIDLYHYQHMSYREIAEYLDLPDGTVMNRLFRARRKLQASLQSRGITP